MASKTNIQPLFDFVLIRPVKQAEVTASGIILPESVKEEPQVGEVMAIGPGGLTPEGKTTPMVVKKGQKVLFKKWGKNEIKVEGEEWFLIEQKEIMAVVSQ
jgi:chaperonin GroES